MWKFIGVNNNNLEYDGFSGALILEKNKNKYKPSRAVGFIVQEKEFVRLKPQIYKKNLGILRHCEAIRPHHMIVHPVYSQFTV